MNMGGNVSEAGVRLDHTVVSDVGGDGNKWYDTGRVSINNAGDPVLDLGRGPWPIPYSANKELIDVLEAEGPNKLHSQYKT